MNENTIIMLNSINECIQNSIKHRSFFFSSDVSAFYKGQSAGIMNSLLTFDMLTAKQFKYLNDHVQMDEELDIDYLISIG